MKSPRVIIPGIFIGLLMLLGIVAEGQDSENSRSRLFVEYINTVNTIQFNSGGQIKHFDRGLRVAARNRNRSLRDMLLEDTRSVLFGVIEDLKSIKPPEGFEKYHDELLNTYIYRSLATESLLSNDLDSASKLNRASQASNVRALEKLINIMSANGAPSDMVDAMARKLESAKYALER